DQLQDEFACPRNVQVDADVALDHVLMRVVAGHAVHEREGITRDVRGGRLDLDHLGTQVGQVARAQRTRQHAGQVNDLQAFQWSSHDQTPSNLAWPGPFFKNDSSPVITSLDDQMAFCNSPIARSAASTPWAAAMEAICLV